MPDVRPLTSRLASARNSPDRPRKACQGLGLLSISPGVDNLRPNIAFFRSARFLIYASFRWPYSPTCGRKAGPPVTLMAGTLLTSKAHFKEASSRETIQQARIDVLKVSHPISSPIIILNGRMSQILSLQRAHNGVMTSWIREHSPHPYLCTYC